MKEPTRAYLDKAQELLDKVLRILSVDDYEDAGRAAYMAGFHAAQALLFEINGRIYKTHNGINAELTRLLRDDARVDDGVRAFLGRTYNLKAIADYVTGPGSHISADMARDAIESARRFVEYMAALTAQATDRR